MITLILGGARSGKSSQAEQLAKNAELGGRRVIYVATAGCFDDEMTQRITHHQQNRPSHWQTVEEMVDLACVLEQFDDDKTLILVDCLTLWLSNLLCVDDTRQLQSHQDNFLQQLTKSQADIILVSNETGLGIVPMGQLTRQFVDTSGFLHQKIAQMADKVLFCVAGLPMVLKG